MGEGGLGFCCVLLVFWFTLWGRREDFEGVLAGEEHERWVFGMMSRF